MSPDREVAKMDLCGNEAKAVEQGRGIIERRFKGGAFSAQAANS
jgi:hypothetical protein